MKSFLKVIVLLLILLIITGYMIYKAGKGIEISNPKEKEQIKQESVLDKLSLEQKIGQLFMIGFDGKVLTPEIEELVRKTHPGAILLLGRNIGTEKQLKELIDSLQKISLEDTGLPLLIAIDQEGGLVSRINWIENTPQSDIKDAEQAYNIGKKRGKELEELGINLNLAPVLDTPFPNDFIYERSFQGDIEEIKELASALIKGQQDAGIFTCIKHFPGYGGITFNPEEKLASLKEYPEISQFKGLGAEMIMTSNVIYNKEPFTFSSKDIQFLKEIVGEDYIIVSDDLDQNSLLNEYSLNDIVSLPIKAGVDMLIFSGWRSSAEIGVYALIESVNNGDIFEERINQSVLKIIELKNEIQN